MTDTIIIAESSKHDNNYRKDKESVIIMSTKATERRTRPKTHSNDAELGI